MDSHCDTASFALADAEFTAAWSDPANTRFELPPVDINGVLRDRYSLSRPFSMTRSQLWDMEVKKAWDPGRYIPYVVSEGSSWGRETLADGADHFCRASMQQAWIADGRCRVLEEVFIDHPARRILFLGRLRMMQASGLDLAAGTMQPLFHVEHGAGGTESEPINSWRIVFLTAAHDTSLIAPFERMVAAGRLPGFVEIYIERDLGVGLGS